MRRLECLIRLWRIKKVEPLSQQLDNYLVNGEIVALSDLLIKLFDAAEASDESGRRSIGQLTVEN